MLTGDYMKLSDSGKLREILRKYNPQLQDTEESFVQTYEKVMKGFPDILKKKIREVRIEHKLGQIELAKRIGTTQSTYSSWETGSHIPKIDNIRQMAEVLDVDPSAFIELNPMEGHDKRDLPILDKSFFAHSSFLDFQAIINNPKAKGVRSFRPVFTEDEAEFCFDVGNCSDMKGRDGISPYSLVTCKASHLKGKTKEEIFNSVNGSVCVVSVNGGEGILRQVFFDGSFLRIHAWNKDVDDRLFPVKKSFLSSLSSFAKVVIFQNNIKQDDVLLADDIEIYGVTIEQIRSIAFIPHD